VTQTVVIPPPAQLAVLERGYADAIRARRQQLMIGLGLAAIAVAMAWIGAEVDLGALVKIRNFTSYFGRILHLDDGSFVLSDPADWFWGIKRWSRMLGETLLIAYVGTFTGFVLGFIGSFLCSANLIKSKLLRITVKRFLEICRTVPDIVFALIFVVAFGLGPMPGVMAIAIHTTGALGKLYSEVVESIDMAPIEGVIATGGTWIERVRFGVLPQVLSNFASYALLRLEVNVRGAAVIGFVGAGGIGEELIVAIRKFYYSDVSAILIMLVVCVMVIDIASERLRHRMLAMERGR
jgi:phosphonate transport system permease protein